MQKLRELKDQNQSHQLFQAECYVIWRDESDSGVERFQNIFEAKEFVTTNFTKRKGFKCILSNSPTLRTK